MPNLKVLLFQLEDIKANIHERAFEFGVSFDPDSTKNLAELIQNLITVLKPKPPIEEQRKVLAEETDDGPVYFTDIFYRCPSCTFILARTNKNKDKLFCSHCGQAVKWD